VVPVSNDEDQLCDEEFIVTMLIKVNGCSQQNIPAQCVFRVCLKSEDPECLFSCHAGLIQGMDVSSTSHLMATTTLDRERVDSL